MTVEELVADLDAIDPEGHGDSEINHSLADDLLLEFAGPEVTAAYKRLQDRQDWWACA